MVTRVVNLNDLSPSVEHELNVLRIGAGTSWANPYSVVSHDSDYVAGAHETGVSLAKYVLYLSEMPDLQRAIPTLAGRILGCICPPGRCHGDILAALADGRESLPALVQRAGEHLWRHRVDPAFFWVTDDLRPHLRSPELRERRGTALQWAPRWVGEDEARGRQMALAV